MNFRTIFDESTKIWSGEGTSLFPNFDPEKSLGSAVISVLEKSPDKIGQISANNGIQMTNGEIRWRTIRAAQNLTKMNIGFDDVIQVIAENHHFLAPVVFGALTVGAPVNALDVKFTQDEILDMLKMVRPKLIICDFSVVETVKGALQQLEMECPILAFDGSTEDIRNVEVLFDETETDVESFEAPLLNDAYKHPAALVCTSGTTGLPKCVSLSHVALYAPNFRGRLTSDDSMLNFSSLYWLSGWANVLMTTLQGATRIITTEPFTSELWLRLVEEHKVTTTLTPPHLLALILEDPTFNERNISTLKLYLCTGGMVSQDLCDRMNMRLNKQRGVVVVTYAMSETAGSISANVSILRPGSVGQLLPGFHVKIISENGDSCGIDEVGEIYVQPHYRCLGYCGDEGNAIKDMDEDGWIRTGDVGHFDSEGFLYLHDRKKEILKYCNDQVSPTEIEHVLMQLPGVVNVCVVGIADDLAGDLPAAVIIKSAACDVSENDIGALMKAKLSDAKQLRGGIYFVDDLPVTPSGKVIRRKVQEIANELYKK